MEEGGGELKGFLMKIIVPAIVGVAIRLAIVNRKKPLTIVHVLTSFITGVGFAYLLSDYVMSELDQKYWSGAISLIAISGDKIGNYLIYRLNIDTIIKSVADRYRK